MVSISRTTSLSDLRPAFTSGCSFALYSALRSSTVSSESERPTPPVRWRESMALKTDVTSFLRPAAIGPRRATRNSS